MLEMRGRWAVAVALSVVGCATLRAADKEVNDWARVNIQGKEPKPGASASPPAASSPASPDPASVAVRVPEATGGPTDAPPPTTSAEGAAAAEALFESGHQAMQDGDYDTACERFRESNRLEPAIGAELNLALCEEKRGRLATAWQSFRRVVSVLQPTDERYPFAERHANELDSRVPRLTVKLAPGAPPTTRVTDGAVTLVGASIGVPIPVDPGVHELIVDAPDYRWRKYRVELVEGQRLDVLLGPGAKK